MFAPTERARNPEQAGLGTVAREWFRLGLTGFGGPPAHISLLRRLCVVRRAWVDPDEFEDAVTACNLLPGPASTQLAIWCAWRVHGVSGALIGGLGFILPGLAAVTGLAAIFLATSPPLWALAAGAGSGAALPAVALGSAAALAAPSWARAPARGRWLLHALVGVLAAAFAGSWVVVLLLACGMTEVAMRAPWRGSVRVAGILPALSALFLRSVESSSGWPALSWVAAKVGALSYGGGFVIVPLMRHDAVSRYGWMTDREFLDAVALGQITPGPVVQTISVVGFAASGLVGALWASLVAFAPSFVLVLAFARRFGTVRASATLRCFLDGAGAAAIGAIAGVSIPLAGAIEEWWQAGIAAAAILGVIALRKGVLTVIVASAALAIGIVALGAPLP